ncbi:MAG: phosphoribosylformylglycinamidine synthase subunit PurL [Nitriliruptoraceae bacterium]
MSESGSGSVDGFGTSAHDWPSDEALTEDRARTLGYELGLRGDEFDRILDTLGRVPTVSELGMYSVMWSEHCSYKSSKIHLRQLASTAPWVLAGPGENAGVVDVGDGLGVAFKIESHNHPSFVEPYQGAATGVGGILRDVFTMGARPIAIMDPLRFGDPGGWIDGTGRQRPIDPLQRRIVDGVVRGVGGYGNCVGVPNIGGELAFDDTYAGNPLVNVLAIGVLRQDRMQLARARAVGDVAILLGSATGRDGIGGASVLASQEFDDGMDDKRPNVQVGDPFAEKLLIECCLELAERDLLAGIQDMGAAGIACSTSELAAAAGLGMDVDLDAVLLREPSMESWEILCSESQERMLALVDPGDVGEVLAIAQRLGVPAAVVGAVTEGDRLILRRDGEIVADVPAASLADDGPVYDRPRQRPAWLDDYAAIDADALDVAAFTEAAVYGDHRGLPAFILRFLASPNVASPRWVTDQYDQFVRAGTVLAPTLGDAGVVRLPDSRRGVACATDGNGRWCEIDPAEGTRRIVAEAFRNVACVGAKPLATTNCLNFGNPERPEIMWQLATSIAALAEATDALGIPVTGGNVSLYNETRGRAIHPSPVVGVLGILDDATLAVDVAFEDELDVILLVGSPTVGGLAGSEFQRFVDAPLGGVLAGVDLDAEAALAEVLHQAAQQRLLASAHDVSAGGLLVTLVESCLGGDVGAEVTLPPGAALTQALFGESPGRVVVSLSSANVRAFAQLCRDAEVPVVDLGTVTGERLVVAEVLDLDLDDVREAFDQGVGRAVEG